MTMNRILVIAVLGISVAALAFSQSTSQTPDQGFFSPADIKWVDAPASLPPGAKAALLEGNPAQEGPFTMRLKVPDGYRIPPHWHPAVEHVTVISGTFNLGMGESFDQAKTRALTAGSFGFMPPGMRHFAWAKGETVIQIHGMGPWKLNYVSASDDPRNRKQ